MQPKHFHEIHPWFQKYIDNIWSRIYRKALSLICVMLMYRLWIMSDHFQAAVDQKQKTEGSVYRQGLLFVCVCVFIRAY